ncbi:S26 family signal peptidase [Actinoplanes italicus]|uniref:S26 family signal peptidase n=1 Tax=Actinoplanes italicus TaxID=113567 RepID=UPI0014726E11|nr:S26 family signal peptidase [Actinoplanes italicus]
MGALGLGILGVLALRRSLLIVEVTGHSMEPAHRSGARLLALRGAQPRRGDVILIRHPDAASRPRGASDYLVKRMAALPGDPVPRAVVPTVGTGVVPPGSCVVLGDNPDSADSRTWGFVRRSTVVGRVLCELRGHGPEASSYR